jgi:hypothetical protein
MAMIFQPDNNAFNFLHAHWKNGHSTYLQSTQHTTLINIPGRALHTQHKTHGNDLTRSTSTIRPLSLVFCASAAFPGRVRFSIGLCELEIEHPTTSLMCCNCAVQKPKQREEHANYASTLLPALSMCEKPPFPLSLAHSLSGSRG